MSSFKMNATSSAIAAALTFAASMSGAATVSDTELTQLRAEAQANGIASVMVHLQNVSLSRLKTDREVVRVAVASKAQRLIDELGTEAWAVGRWTNGAGQIGLYVTNRGLSILAGTSNAVSFFAGKRWHERTHLDGANGAHVAADVAAQKDGAVDVQVTLNVNGLRVVTRSDGDKASKADPEETAVAIWGMRSLLDEMPDSELRNRPAAMESLQSMMDAGGAGNPRLILRVSGQGLIRLADSTLIRDLRPVGYVDQRPRHFDVDALERAQRDGTADVVVVLRDAGMGGALTRASRDAAKAANRSALDEILAASGAPSKLRDFSEFGATYARLTASQLVRLRDSRDARLLAIVDNKPVATTQLAISGPTMNMASAWSAGYRGGAQNVIVFDTGVQANHPFLAGRVALEGCFGTTQAVGGIQYVSVCPQPDAAGDSPLGLAGSAAPGFGGACSTQNPASCAHGTHVSGISAGRTAPNQTTGLQGTAPDAGVIAVQVFSFDQNAITPPQAFFVDILAGLQVAANAIVPNTPASNPYTLNMSLGGGQNAGPCTAAQWAPYITAIQTLSNGGVPVIAATGNDAFDAAISVPACLPGVVKVGSVGNDGVGNARSFFNAFQGSNVANPAAFPGEALWVAPGGGNGTAVQSSVLGNGFAGLSGTSMATPQIAGIYADAKGADPAFTVDGITAFFVGNASVDVPMTARSGAQLNFNLRRILLPAF